MNPITQWFQQRRVRRAKSTTRADLKNLPEMYREMRKLLGDQWHPPTSRIRDFGLILVHHTDPAVRELAVKALLESRVPGIEEHLLSAVKDASPEVRRGAVDWLARAGRSDFTRHLLPAMQDADEAVRAAAAAGLAAGGGECLPPLRVALADPAWSVRASAVRSMGSLAAHADAEAVDAILRLAQNEELDPIRRSAAYALARMSESAAGDYLLGKVKQLASQPGTPKELGELATDVLGRIGRQEGVKPLLAALSHPEPLVRDKALESLGNLARFADPGMADEIILILRTERNDHLRRTALGAVKKLRESPVAGHVGERLTQLVLQTGESDDARVAATLALAEVAGAGSLATLERLAGDGSARLRAAAAWGLGDIKGERSVATLRRLVADRDAKVKEAALAGLKKNDIPLCRRCGAVADRLFGFTKEPVCLTCYSKPGVCQSCGKNVGSDSNLIKISAGKNCRECDARLDQMVSGGFRTSTRIH